MKMHSVIALISCLLFSSELTASVTFISRPDTSLLDTRVSVYSGGPDVMIRASPNSSIFALTMPDVTIHERGRFTRTAVGNDPEKLELLLQAPFMASVDGVDHIVVPAMIFGMSSRDNQYGWYSRLPQIAQLTGDSYTGTGWLLVNASTGIVSHIPVTHSFGAWRVLRAQSDASPGTAVIHSDEEAQAILAGMQQKAAAERELAEQTATEQRELEEQLALVKETGTTVCSPGSTDWQQRGFTEGVSGNGERIQIRISDGDRAGQIIWDDPRNWRTCDFDSTRAR